MPARLDSLTARPATLDRFAERPENLARRPGGTIATRILNSLIDNSGSHCYCARTLNLLRAAVYGEETVARAHRRRSRSDGRPLAVAPRVSQRRRQRDAR